METSNSYITNQQQWNLFQKPIRVEMLASPFSAPIFYDDYHGVVRHFIGVNAEILKVLVAVMNFSGKFFMSHSHTVSISRMILECMF